MARTPLSPLARFPRPPPACTSTGTVCCRRRVWTTICPAISFSFWRVPDRNGSNACFTLSAVPAPTSSLYLYRNGVLQKAGLDYNLSGNIVQFLAGSTPQPGDTLLASYRVTPTGTPQGPPAPQILCSGMGTATSSTTLSSLGT